MVMSYSFCSYEYNWECESSGSFLFGSLYFLPFLLGFLLGLSVLGPSLFSIMQLIPDTGYTSINDDLSHLR